jgi:N-acyl-L-homoserine lactone synthetase
MFELFDASYEELQTPHLNELYRLRKTTFSDRLRWDVICHQGMESDTFDRPGTRYILGMYQGRLVCSVRFIALTQPNMITHTFHTHFNTVALPQHGTESSRFFVDKARSNLLLGKHYPVSQALFLSMINWAQHNNHANIHTIVSRAMLTILRRSGWQITLIKEAYLNEKERIYLVRLPTGKDAQAHLAEKLADHTANRIASMTTWPLMLPV